MNQVDLMNAVRRFISPLSQKVRLMVSRGVVKLVNDSLKCQGLQVELLKDEIHDEVERFQEYGFTSVPKEGAEVLYLSVGGNRAGGVVVCVTDRRYRPKDLGEGDVCLFTEDGERVYLEKATDIVHLGAKAAAEFVALAAKTDTRIGNLESYVSTHTHPATGILDSLAGACTGATSPPIGAPTGSSVAASKVKAT